jgi:hypothetical protein
MGRYKPKGSKRIVSSAVKEGSPKTSIIPTLKSDGLENVFHPEVVVDKNNAVLKDEEAERAEIRNRVGLTYERLCRTVKDGMEAMVCNAETGEPICPANSERAKFIAAAIDLLGAKKAEQGAQRIPSILILLPNGDRLK